MVNREGIFYKKLTEEYDTFMEEIRDWDSEKVVENSEYIADYRNIYEYLMRDKPINENTNLEHFLKMNTPIKTICEIFQENKPPIYDLVNPTIWNIGEKEIFDADYSEIKARFMQRIEENYRELNSKINNQKWVGEKYDKVYMTYDYVRNHIAIANDKDIMVLMQFENPLKVIMEAPESEISKGKIENAAHYVRWSDIYTLPYELDHKRILAETTFRNKAINELIRIIPDYNFNTTMKWLDFFRELHEEQDEPMSKVTDPYCEFVSVMYDIADEYGGKVLAMLYNMGLEHCILENELKEAAKYLATGGDIDNVYQLATYGYFEAPYDQENSMADDEFLEQFKQGSITVG